MAVAALAAALVVGAPTAGALCIYGGKLYATTTVPQEFHDSRWVVRARVLSAKRRVSDASRDGFIYEIEIERAYKGQPPRRLKYFTYNDSGRFDLDRREASGRWVDDIGGEYLLFLDAAPSNNAPSAVRGASIINYNCGQSGPWAAVPVATRRLLDNLAQRAGRSWPVR